MNKSLNAPLTLKALETELRLALLVQASQLGFIANSDAASTFIGQEVDWDHWWGQKVDFDLTNFHIWNVVKAAHQYVVHLDPTDYFRYEINLRDLLGGLCQRDCNEVDSPLSSSDSCLSYLGEKAHARYCFDNDLMMDIKQVSLLIDCDEMTTRLLLAEGVNYISSMYRAREISEIVRVHPNFSATRKIHPNSVAS